MTLVDVRGTGDFKLSHIPTAVNYSYESIGKAELPKDIPIVLYGNSNQCPWSGLAAKNLETAGYKSVYILDGGIAEWIAEKLPLVTATGVQIEKNAQHVAGTSPGKVLELFNNKAVSFIDTRSAKEFSSAHVPGAKNIPLDTLEASLGTLSLDTEWVVYDKDSENSKDAVRLMTAKGFKVKELSGGIQVWAAKKYPLETGTAK